MNFDITESGKISYEVHSTMTALMSIVNNYIQEHNDEDFVGTWMMLVTYNDVPQKDSKEVAKYLILIIRSLHVPLYVSLFYVDKYFPRNHYHQWESVLCCVYLPLWLSLKQWKHLKWHNRLQLRWNLLQKSPIKWQLKTS